MTENMKKFLETVSSNDELYGKFTSATREDLIAMAKALGIELTEADFDQKTELDDDELEAVAGGSWCVCAVGGSGTKSSDYGKSCTCILDGGGEYSQKGGGGCRCACVGGGYGDDDSAMEK